MNISIPPHKADQLFSTSSSKFSGQKIFVDFFTDSAMKFKITMDYHCEAMECDDDDYCRCGSVCYEYSEGAEVTISADDILIHINSKHESSNYRPTEVEKECLGRLMQCFDLYNKYSYAPNIFSGYYGEEVHGVKVKSIKMKNPKLGNFYELCAKIVDLDTDEEKIQFILELEHLSS